jgi:hypothetical protein
MSDQRDHGVGGLEWRDRSRQTPDGPLVPSTGATEAPGDETTAVFRPIGRHGGDERSGRQDGDHTDVFSTGRLSGVLPSDGDQDGPVDLSALRADDELLTALCSFDNSMSGTDQDPELKSLLLSWRLDVESEPIGELVDTDTALATIAVGNRIRHKRKPRYLVPLASAAAVLVVVFLGMGFAARNAEPGDPLWGLSQVLYSEHAQSVEAAASVRSDLHHASEALQQGQFAEARTALAQAQNSLPAVSNEDGKASLQQQQQTLLTQLENTSGVAPVPTPSSYGKPVGSSTSQAPVTTTTTTNQQQPTTTTTTTNPPPSTTTTETPATSTPTSSTSQPQTDTVGNAPAGGNQPMGADEATTTAGSSSSG